MKFVLLCLVSLLAPVASFADDSTESDDTSKLILQCTVKFRDSDPANKEVIVRSHSIKSDDGKSLYALIKDGYSAEYRTDKVDVSVVTASEIQDSDELRELVKLAKVNLKNVATATVYEIERGMDGSLASILAFNNKDGKVLGRSGFFAWMSLGCE